MIETCNKKLRGKSRTPKQSPRKKTKEPKKYYAIAAGWARGIFLKWDGVGGWKEATEGFKANMHKGCTTLNEAVDCLAHRGIKQRDIKVYIERDNPLSLKQYRDNSSSGVNRKITNAQKQHLHNALNFSDSESDLDENEDLDKGPVDPTEPPDRNSTSKEVGNVMQSASMGSETTTGHIVDTVTVNSVNNIESDTLANANNFGTATPSLNGDHANNLDTNKLSVNGGNDNKQDSSMNETTKHRANKYVIEGDTTCQQNADSEVKAESTHTEQVTQAQTFNL